MPAAALIAAITALPGFASHATGSVRPTGQPAAQVIAQVSELVLASGARERLLYLAPPEPRATLLMLPGGAGDVGIEADGQLRHADNFVVRTRDWWLHRGYAVLIPDALDQRNLRGMRSTSAYAAAIGRLVEFARAHNPVPVFLIGTSQGAIAAMNGAATLGPGRVAGVVLTESVTVLGGSHETVFSAHPQQVRVPALVIANRDDACPVAPPSMAPRIAAAMAHAASVQVLYVRGGIARSADPCSSRSPHGYDGIATQVDTAIDTWLRRQLAR